MSACLILIKEIRTRLPSDVVYHIGRFVPRTPKRQARGGLQRELTRLQWSPKMTAMGLYGLEDFVLC